MREPTSVRDILESLTATGSPATPRLVWYAVDGERVELSGRVLATWVSKATNLLVEVAGAAPGTRVLLDLPVHWRAVVWALGAWTAGATLVLDRDEPADVVVTSDPAAFPTHGEVIAVALPALAMAFDQDLPPGVTDGAAELMSFGDSPGYLPPLDDAEPALDDVPHATLLAAAGAAAGAHAVERVLLAPPDTRRAVLDGLGVLAAGGTLVLAGPGFTPERRAELADVEGAVVGDQT